MKITIDYNNDKIYINPDERYEKSEIEFSKSEMKYPLKFVENLLTEVLNVIAEEYDGFSDLAFSVELEKLDENIRTTIGEW